MARAAHIFERIDRYEGLHKFWMNVVRQSAIHGTIFYKRMELELGCYSVIVYCLNLGHPEWCDGIKHAFTPFRL